VAGLLDRPEDFERWYAGLMANRPVSHPMQLDRDALYQAWLADQMQRRGVQPAQMPAALAELSAMSPTMPLSEYPRRRVFGSQPGIGARLRGPGSANIIDQRADFGIGNVANWLRGFPGEDF